MRSVSEIKAEIDRVQAQGDRINALQNEGGEGYDHADNAKLNALWREWQAAVYAQDWTREATIARREAWNNEVRKQAAAGRKPTADSIEAVVRFSLHALRSAIQHYRLDR